MIQALTKVNVKKDNKRPPINDLIVKKPIKSIEYEKDGTRKETITYQKVNVTKKMNETAKLVKKTTAEEKIAEIEKIFTK